VTRPSSSPEDRIAALEAELARLRDSERMFRFSAQLSARLVWASDPQGKLTFLDYPFVALTGMDQDGGLDAGWYGIVHPDDREHTMALWRHSLETGETYLADFRVRRADGTYRLTRSRAIAVRGEGEVIRCWYGTTEDIEDEIRTEEARREAVERLRESEDMHRHTLEMSQQIAWTAEADGTGLVMSARYEELTGMGDPSEARLSIHPDDREQVTGAWTRSMTAGVPFATRCRLRMKDGGYRFMRVRASPQRDEDGRIVRWYGVTEDVHDQELAERARRDVEARYRLAVQATDDAIWDYDIVQNVIDWSDNAGSIFGAGAEPIGRTSVEWWHERLHPEDRERVAASLREAIDGTDSRWSASYRFRRDDGSYADVLDRGFIIRAGDGGAVRAVGAMSDVTEQHRTQSEMRRMQAELIHVSRLSAMGTMASTLAHELNQPLTALSNFISGTRRLAEKPEVPREVLTEALGGAEAAAQRAGEILRRLRTLVSRGTVATVVDHLPQLVEEACVLAFIDATVLGIRHRLALDATAVWVRADRIQIQQVIINLVRNAVEAMEDCAEREVVISTRPASGNMVEISVADTGTGIEREAIETLFSQFMTTKTGGMGIGLPISRTIIEAHGGKIWAENRDDGGAVFRFTLPRAKRREATPRL
jgi:two-component system sensor kinase FixL